MHACLLAVDMFNSTLPQLFAVVCTVALYCDHLSSRRVGVVREGELLLNVHPSSFTCGEPPDIPTTSA